MLIIKAEEMKLFKNLAVFQYENIYYDFHNGFDFKRILLTNNNIELQFKHTSNGNVVLLIFSKAEIVKLDFEFTNNNGVLTIDNLYRGRFEVEGKLEEFNVEQKSYYYLEFYEGQKLEFFCETIKLINVLN